jgi:mono/diheme cytochrome c family protein
LYAYTRTPRALRTSGDTAALHLHQKYAAEMPAFATFTDDELAAIYAFIAAVYHDSRPLDSLRKAEMAR